MIQLLPHPIPPFTLTIVIVMPTAHESVVPALPAYIKMQRNLYNMVISRVVCYLMYPGPWVNKDDLIDLDEIVEKAVIGDRSHHTSLIYIPYEELETLVLKGEKDKLYERNNAHFSVTPAGKHFFEAIMNHDSMAEYGIDIDL